MKIDELEKAEKLELHLDDISLMLTEGKNAQLRYHRCAADDFTMECRDDAFCINQVNSAWANGRQGTPKASWLLDHPSIIITLPNLKEVSGVLSRGSGKIEKIGLEQLEVSVFSSFLKIRDVICNSAKLHAESGSIETSGFTVETACTADAWGGRISLTGVLNEKAGYQAVSINGSIDFPHEKITGMNEIGKKGTPFFHLTAKMGRITIS